MNLTCDFTESAVQDIQAELKALQKVDPHDAAAVWAGLKRAILHLCDFPELGQRGKQKGVLERKVPDMPYVILYQKRGNILTLLRIYHQLKRPQR